MGCGDSSLHADGARKRATAIAAAGFGCCVINGMACTGAGKIVEDFPALGKKSIACSMQTEKIAGRETPKRLLPSEAKRCKRKMAH